MSSMGVANSRPPFSTSTSTITMGATDVLPYPRRRSSVQLEPLELRLSTAERESQQSPIVKSASSGTEEDVLPGTVFDPSTPPSVLNPVRINGHKRLTNSVSDDTRCNSCENPRPRGRSHSLHPTHRPGEAGRRRLASNDVDDDETTAEFIEKLRKELIGQMTHV